MKNRNNRYANMERIMLTILIALTVLFIIFLFASGAAVTLLKVICAIVAITGSLLCLTYLYLTGELMRQRSLWMSAAFAGILLCTVFSLLLNFPCPKP